MTQPNRLEKVWPQIRKDLLTKWDQIPAEAWDACHYQYDLVVELVRRNYYPGRSHLTYEADIRDWLNDRIAHHFAVSHVF